MKRQRTALLILALALGAKCATQAALIKASDNQQAINPQYLESGDSRTFLIEYTGKIQQIPTGTRTLRVWIPVPQNSTVQTIRELSFSSPPRLTTEPKYGNRIAYWEIQNPSPFVDLTIKFICARQELRLHLDRLKEDGSEPKDAFQVFRKPDALVTIDHQIKQLSAQITAGTTGSLAKARAIYDYVLGNMTYDKSHPGWGFGSTRHACEAGEGNCTDFHALFNSLCRAQGIASGFEIGLYLPYERNKDEKLGGYHCWAFFRVPGKTWVPVDCSEANRMPERTEFFFGGHTNNRVALSTGRDLVLEPKQQGEPLNYFLNPYAEADGKPVNADKTWSYKDLD